ncbi:MAG: hypothetical protein EB020_04565 [Proteobacteria bacterium]|nr:hypothetical protein [Pseudomonadota bacterium]
MPAKITRLPNDSESFPRTGEALTNAPDPSSVPDPCNATIRCLSFWASHVGVTENVSTPHVALGTA